MSLPRIGFVGAGRRANFHFRVLRETNHFDLIGAVTKTPEADAERLGKWKIPPVNSIEALLALKPDAIAVATPWNMQGGVLMTLRDVKLPILAETPPAPTLEELMGVLDTCGKLNITFSEQYLYRPYFEAVHHILKKGLLGAVHYAHVSVAHGYHGVAVTRALLGAGSQMPKINAYKHKEQIDAIPSRDGTAHLVGVFEWPDRMGVIDFIGSQYVTSIRPLHLTLRGRRGEIHDETVRYYDKQDVPVEMSLRRDMAGGDGSLTDLFLRGIMVGEDGWRNPYQNVRLTDEEIAIATVYRNFAETVTKGTPSSYSLAQACQDQLLSLAWEKSAETGQAITPDTPPWQKQLEASVTEMTKLTAAK